MAMFILIALSSCASRFHILTDLGDEEVLVNGQPCERQAFGLTEKELISYYNKCGVVVKRKLNHVK